MIIKKRLKYLFLAVLLVVSIIISGQVALSAFNISHAETTVYSDVLDDLEKDETFNLQDYPQIADSYDIELVQIAESTTGELLLYVYQPGNGTLSEDVICNYVNIATDEKGLEYNRYTLTFLDSTNTFSKYKVNNFTVSTDTYRYYTISAIYRPWISGVDETPAEGTYIDSVDYIVGWTWRVYYLNNELTYECKHKQVVEITDGLLDSLRYPDGYILSSYTGGCDSHFIAFNCDFEIDNLLSADIVYSAQTYRDYLNDLNGEMETSTYGDAIIDAEITVSSQDEEVIFYPSSWFNPLTYEWNRIQTAQDFVDNESYETMNEDEFVNRYQYVLRFLETSYDKHLVPLNTYYEYTNVYNVQVFRLHFISDGKVYNLGAVSNMYYSDNIFGNNIYETIKNETKEEFKETWEKIEKVLAVVLIILIIVVLSPILNILITFFKLLFKGVKIMLSIVLIPFRLISKRQKK